MCLSTVYELRDGQEHLVSEYVSSVDIGKDEVTFTDIVGNQSTVRGSIRNIDLVNNKILVEA